MLDFIDLTTTHTNERLQLANDALRDRRLLLSSACVALRCVALREW
jgi:hypothetical protein